MPSRRFRRLSRKQMERLKDQGLRLKMDAANVARRQHDRAARNRECGCGTKLDPRTTARYCQVCAAVREAPPYRTCPGDDGDRCGEDITGTRRRRCEVCATSRRLRLDRLRAKRYRVRKKNG